KGGHLFSLGHSAQDLSRDIGQQGIGEDVVHVACAALDFGAAAGDLVKKGLVVGELYLVVFQNAPLDLAQLEPDDLLQRLVAHRVVGDHDHAPKESRLEDFVE